MSPKFLTKSWNDNHLGKIKNKAGNRYTPKLNVDIPIAEVFDGITRSERFYHSTRAHFGKLKREFSRVSSDYANKEIQAQYAALSKLIFKILDTLDGISRYDVAIIPWKRIENWSKKAQDLSWKFLELIRNEKDNIEKTQGSDDIKKQNQFASEKLSGNIHYIYETQKELRYFTDFSSSVAAKLSNSPFLVLTGIAGNGKTHLLCDLVENRIKKTNQLPSILLFGEYFNEERDLWKQIAIQIGLADTYDKTKILSHLNKAGQRNNSRSILIIDALNETRPMTFWRKNLKKLLADVKDYPHVALIVSIRSGFENQILLKTVKKLFVHEEHPGFRFREWEAVTKFFKEFHLPLPEIPLLMPEFQNPLFLLLFCKAFERRKGTKKQIFRGHEGANYIFEHFVDSVAKRIERRFKIDSGPGKNVWDKIIEQIAAEMVDQNNDRLPEEKIVEIVENAYPAVNHSKLLTEIEKNLLLIKVVRYSEGYTKEVGFDYRFPFQKFSDHLVARYVFKKYRLSGKSAKQFFSKDTDIGKYLLAGWNMGIIEALSIQCPEQLRGVEFFELAPYIDDQLMVEAFIQSLIWRRPEAFNKDLKTVLSFINKKVIYIDYEQSKLLNAFLSVAPIPNHPFNAQFLHKHLAKTSMPKRDAWWSTFLHNEYKERKSVDRLIEWGWSDHDKTHIQDEPMKLCCVALTWFLTTSNRFVRDKATKALVELLTDRLSVVVELVDQFKAIDDPYVIERLYAVAYGCVLRNREDKKGLTKLAQWFYKNVFKDGRTPDSILIRDYARGIVEVAVERGLIKVNLDRVKPPYGSRWPKNVPSEKALRDKYYPKEFMNNKTENRGYLDIWSSVMANYGSLGDFGRYIVDSALSHWSGRKLAGGKISKREQFERFKKSLGTKRLRLFNKIDPFFGLDISDILKNIKVTRYQLDQETIPAEHELETREQEQEVVKQKRIEAFKKSLSAKEKKFYEKEIEPHLNGGTQINDPSERFDSGLGQRWIFNRVIKLGWKEKLHGQFDRYMNHGQVSRTEHKAERIGKKYQWIAFHEFLGLVADNYEFKGDSWAENSRSAYEGPWQLSVRDIDPSCTLGEALKDAPKDIPIMDISKINYNAWRRKATDATWLRAKQYLPDPKSIIEMQDNNGIRWLMIEGYTSWEEQTPPEHEKYNIPTRRLYYIVKSYLVKKRNAAKAYNWAAQQDFYGRWMPESHEFYNVYLGEYPASPAFLPYSREDNWTNEGRYNDNKIPVKVRITNDEYQSSGSSIDCSTEGSINLNLPAKLIIDEMKLIQKYTDGRFFDKDGLLVAFDPTVFTKDMPNCLLFRKDALCRFLTQGGYDILWTVLGEKNIIGGGTVGQPLGWLKINGAFKLSKAKNLVGIMKSSFEK